MHAKPRKQASKISDRRRCDFTRSEWLEMLWARYSGDAPLSRIADRYVDATREFMRLSRTNFAELVVDALQDRTKFIGVRPAAGDSDGDDDARGFIEHNGSFFDDALMYTYALGEGYVLVGPPDNGDRYALATAEDPRQVIVETDPAKPRVVLAALKLYRDDVARQHVAALYLRGDPSADGELQRLDRVRTAVRPGESWSGSSFSPRSWFWDESRSHPLAVQGLGVPVVPLANKLGMGEFERHLDLLDRITNGIADRLWASKYQVFIQRAIEGDLPDHDPQTGKKIDYSDIFSADPAALWKIPPGSKIWESRQLDINALLAPVRDDVKEFSAVTRTPLHMFSPDAMTGSAEGASLSREGISFKAEDRIKRLSHGAIRVARLGLAYSGLPVDDMYEAMWAPVERFSLQQRGSAAVQAHSSGIPDETIWTDIWQFPPSSIPRMRRQRREQVMYAADTPTDGSDGSGGPAAS